MVSSDPPFAFFVLTRADLSLSYCTSNPVPSCCQRRARWVCLSSNSCPYSWYEITCEKYHSISRKRFSYHSIDSGCNWRVQGVDEMDWSHKTLGSLHNVDNIIRNTKLWKWMVWNTSVVIRTWLEAVRRRFPRKGSLSCVEIYDNISRAFGRITKEYSRQAKGRCSVIRVFIFLKCNIVNMLLRFSVFFSWGQKSEHRLINMQSTG